LTLDLDASVHEKTFLKSVLLAAKLSLLKRINTDATTFKKESIMLMSEEMKLVAPWFPGKNYRELDAKVKRFAATCGVECWSDLTEEQMHQFYVAHGFGGDGRMLDRNLATRNLEDWYEQATHADEAAYKADPDAVMEESRLARITEATSLVEEIRYLLSGSPLAPAQALELIETHTDNLMVVLEGMKA
jgi:hypothetical protein